MIDLATALTVVYLSRLTPALVANVASIYAMVTAQLRATVTTNAFGQVIGRTTVAANASTIAIRGMSGALANQVAQVRERRLLRLPQLFISMSQQKQQRSSR